MRALLELVETGVLMARTRELEESLDKASLRARRSAGILRPTGDGTTEELSPSDFMRALRGLYAIEGRGLPVPGVFDPAFQSLGWTRDEGGDRAVVLVTRSTVGLPIALHYPGRALLLVPTARAVTARHRERHGPGRYLHVEVLEEALTVRRGKLARAGASTSDASAASRALHARVVLIPGVLRWNQVRMCLVNQRTLRIDVPGKSIRVTHVDLGMAHHRSREPTRLWEVLVELCEEHGYFKTRRFGSKHATKQVLSRLRKGLAAIFGLEDDPFEPYRRGTGWRACFQARPDLPDGLPGDPYED